MLITITDRDDLLDGALQELAERRLRFALSRFDNRVSRLELVVGDENGPRGGVDKSCRLTVRLKRARDVVITDKDESMAACISRVAERAARSVARAIDRQQDFDRVRPSFVSPARSN
ncbi:MAG: HPF/RaiA family ribosome-associated protein [Planctomycetota bacterium]